MNLAYPFNLVSGLGLGISYSSFTQLGAALASRDFGPLKIQSFVNVNTGNLTLFDHKLVLQERNFPVELSYVYNSHAQTVSGIWRLAHKYFKTIPASTASPAVLVEEDGHETSYQFDSKTNRWVSPYWSDSRAYLSHDATEKKWSWFDPKTQITEIYNESGYLLQRLDSKNEATTYRYDQTTPWQLTTIEAPGCNYEIRRTQLADGSHQESIYSVKMEEATLLKFSSFDIDGRLTKTTIALDSPDRSKWPSIEYKYLAPPKSKATLSDKDVYTLAYLDKLEQSDGSGVSFNYGTTSGAVPRPITTFSYQNPSDVGSLSANFQYGQGNTIIQNNVQVSTKLYFNQKGSITQIDRDQGYPSVVCSLPVDSSYYTYNENGQLSSLTSAEQGKQSFQYSDDGRLIKQQNANGQTKEYYYDQTGARNNLITQVSYINNKAQVIRKVYDQAYGDSGKGLYLRFEISPEGRVTEYRVGDANFIQFTVVYLDGRFPIDNYTKNTAPSLADMASWVAQQNPQRVSLTQRINDQSGLPSHTYRYATIDAKGQGISDAYMSQLDTDYNIFGDLCYHSETLKKDQPTLDTNTEFDNLRRLISLKNAAEEKTSYLYADRRVEITRPNSRKEITELDTQGWIAKQQQTIQVNNQALTRETTYSRNIAGCTTEKCTTADGQFSYRFYDKQNRLGFIVHPSGSLTEFRYNQQSRYKATVRYAKAIDKLQLASTSAQGTEPSVNDLLTLMTKMSISDPTHDRISYEFYDTSERLCYQVDEEAYVSQNIYNDYDQLIVNIKHDTKLLPEQLAALLKGKKIALAIDAKRDRTQHIFYDADRNKIGLQDAAGYVTEYKRNGANWVTEIIRYAQKQMISINTQSFDKIRPDANADDAHEYRFYDPRGWLVLSVDAEGYITTKDYLLNGVVNSEKRYANPVDATWYSNTQVMPNLPAMSDNDQSINYQYDKLNREIENRQSDGKITFTRYDNMGEIIAHGVRDALTTEISGDSYRANESRVDGWGQTLAEAAAQNCELLARIDADSSLKPEEKQQQKEKIWNENTRRHVYDASGLKLSTAVRSRKDASDQLTYFYYNAERQLILTLQVVGDKQTQIQEYTRDNFNNIVKTRDYSQVKATLADKFKLPLTGGFIPEALRKALDALQDATQDVITQKFYNKRDEAIKLIDAEGFETQHLPNAFSEISQTSLPVQTKQPTLIIQHQYDARGLETSTQHQADALSSKVKRAYSNLYGKLTHLADELKGDYQRGYDRKGRLIWTQNPVQQQRSNIAYDAWDKPTKITNALGLSTQHLYDLSKRSETIVDPLGNKRSIIRNIFAEKIKEIDADLHTQTWQHSADGQISRYTDALGRGYIAVYNLLGSLTERQILNGIKTQYVYDAIGHLITKIQDAQGAKRQTQYQYNLLGHCVKTIDAKGIVQQNKYDRRGLVIEQCLDAQASGLNLITTRQYNGQKQLLSETQGDKTVADQYTRQLDYDGLNRQCKTTIDPITETRKDALNIQTQHHRNGQNSVLAEIDANGQVTRFILDTAGRRCFQINALGGVTEWKYNQADQIILERQYQQAITGNEVTPINDETTPEQLRALLKPNAEDTLTYQFYDANGNQRFAVSCNGQQGYVKEKRYDALQREIQTIQYATAINIKSVEKFTTELLAAQVIRLTNPTQDRGHYFLRDEVGQLRFSIDPQNYVHEQRFDAQGHLIAQISYANSIEDPAQLIKLPIAEVLSHINKDDTQDRYQFFFFDSLGQPLYTVKSEGQVISYQHDAKGNLTEEVHFNQRLIVPQEYALLRQQLQILKPDATQDRITQKAYDAANRLIKHTDALGFVETYQYDALGNRTTYSDWQQSIWKTVFDRAKRPTIETTPPVYIVEVTPNAFGALAWTGQIIPIEKHKVYDKVGNIARITTAANTTEPRVFEAEYNGLNQWQMTHLPDIAVDNATALKPDDWRHRPETKQTLTSTRTTNAKGLKVAEQDAAGHWQFWVYDQQQRLVYYVKPLGVTIKKERDAFGKIQRKITFATPCALDLSAYTQTGIPKSVLDDYYQTRELSADRIITYHRDQHGRVVLQRQGPVHCYVSAPIAKLSEEYAEIRKSYNAWGQIIAQTEKIDPTRKKEKFYWFDRNGLRLAEVDSVGLDNQTPQYRCQRFENDSFGQMAKSIAYAKSLDASINAHLPFVELKNAFDKIAAKEDRTDQFYYDKANRLVKKVRLQAIRQTLQLTGGLLPTFTDAPAQDISVSYQYNGNGQIISKTLEDGSMEWSFYDRRGCKNAQTDMPRDNHGFTNVIVPLTYHEHNAHGQTVLTTRFKTGTLPVTPGSLPKPLATDPADQQELRLFDGRGKLQWKQSNQQIPRGFSYNANGKPARQWWTLSNWVVNQVYEKRVHLDEKYFQYDAQNRAITVEVRRDSQTIETNCTAYDAFDQAIMEGEKLDKMHIYRRFDQLGRMWCTNVENGAPTLFLHDLTGLCVLRMQSATQDFGFMTYRELPNVLSWSIVDVERTENQRDLAGRVITRTLPANYQVDMSQPQIIPLSILASNGYPKLGKIQSLSWPIPQEKNAVAEFSLWPKDMPAQKQTLPIVTQEGRCGVDVSSLATDVYQYEVLYYFTNGNELKKLLYKSSGIIQFAANNVAQSQHLVALTDQQQPSIVRLAGNTGDITRVELWQDLEKIATLDLQLDPKTHQYSVGLSRYTSGEYQLKPQKQDKTPQALSLAFTTYTPVPAIEPLSREINTTLQFNFLANHVEINWQVSPFLQTQPVKLQCHYVDVQDKQQIHECELSPNEKRTPYTDKNGKQIQSNVTFAQAIKSIVSISLAIKCPIGQVTHKLADVKDHWLLLAATSDASSDEEEWEMIPHAASLAANDEKDDWIPVYQNELPILPAVAPPSFDPTIINDLSFSDKRLVMVTPVPDLKELKTPPTLEYLDVSLDRMRRWAQFASINLTAQGFVVDVTSFNAGVYPFRCHGYTGNLVITLGGLVFPTQDMIEPDRQHLVQPARRYSYNLWNNKLTETDSLGHTTQFIYNDSDQIIQKIEPLVDVVDEQGNTKALCPTTTFAYNIRGLQIAKRDANGNTSGYILDAAGHKIIEILAKGTKRKIQLFDEFNNVCESRDGAGQITKYFYDQENNLLEFYNPVGRTQVYTYNEQKQRNSVINFAKNARHYNFDALGNLTERYEPLGQCTQMFYGRYHQQFQQINPDGSRLTWQRDTFGKPLQHTDLSGAVYHYGYDYKAQLVDVMSEEGNHGECMKMIPVIAFYKQEIFPVPGQRLHYQYISGRVTEIDDFATGKKTYYSYDSEGRRFAISVVSQAGEILRETTSQVDALGREILTRDKQAIFTTAYDSVSNRRFIKAVVNAYFGQLTQEVWWKYDVEDNVILAEGVLENEQIKITSRQGSEFTYQDDRRITEKKLVQVDESSAVVIATLQYDVDGRLTGSLYNTGERTERQLELGGWQHCSYTDIVPQNDPLIWWIKEKIHIQHDDYYNENGWLTSTTQIVDEGNLIKTDYQSFTALGLPQQQTIIYNDEANNQDHLQYNYVGWDSWRVASIGGYRANKYGTSDYSSVKNFLGPNGESSAISGAQSKDGTGAEDKYFETTPDGLILSRMNLTDQFINNTHTGLFICKQETYYFYRVNGQYLGSYTYGEELSDEINLLLNWVRHGERSGAGRELGILQGNNPGRAISFDPLTEANDPNDHSYGSHDYFSDIPKTYICVAGDTYQAIAEKIYGDGSLASYIDAANGGGTLIAGQTIVIPQLISVHNKAGMARPYYQFLSIIQGSFMPHLDTPQPPPPDDDDDFFGILICAVVVVVAIAVAPEVCTALLGASAAAAGGVTVDVVTGVFVGLAEASAQGLCVGLGLKDHFSLAEAITAGITAGFATGLGPFKGFGAKQLMVYILKVGMVNVEEQLAEMAIGIRQQFDLTSVALAMGEAGLSAKIKLDNPLEQRLVSDIGNAAMSSAVHGRFEVENLASQLISDSAGYAVQQAQAKSVSDEYQESQKASRGEGYITRTTIEQQWDSHLINDAEFTANTQLPSVTFDVNDSYVSQHLGQRVGEEVSHFYHPTPPPPRNPTGFWRGVDDVMEMQEGTRKAADLIFTGHYEVPKNRWQKAGFDIGVPLAIGAQIVMAGERVGVEAVEIIYQGGQQLGKGLMQASRLMNRWGLFGSGEVQSLETGIPQIGQKIYRVWGGEAGSYGKSWTRTDPSTISDYRSKAGLPNQNTGRFISEGSLTNIKGVEARSALPLHEHPGGLDELLIPNSREQVELENVSGINPQY
ncbi:hypothetical protein [Rickettsiella endosymbiont of Aleochara curtula]|uniref:hypothetical protein n=1 Tax=Rickettsiella endosymbiont of Aleochara curtula TaxID=3077936 RepID=UPI00313EEF96